MLDKRVAAVEQILQEGNSEFRARNYVNARDIYTRGIYYVSLGLPDRLALKLYLNRARCSLKLEDWANVELDARSALNHDEDDFGAHYLLGKALVYQKKFVEGVTKLRRAKRLAGSAQDFEAIAIHAELEAKHIEWRDLRDAETLRDTQLLAELDQLQLSEQSTARVRELLAMAETQRTPGTIPKYLCCSITLSLMKVPVICPVSGITYEKCALESFVARHGPIDPCTRESFDMHSVVTNLAIKEAIEDFLAQHPWAVEDWS